MAELKVYFIVSAGVCMCVCMCLGVRTGAIPAEDPSLVLISHTEGSQPPVIPASGELICLDMHTHTVKTLKDR